MASKKKPAAKATTPARSGRSAGQRRRVAAPAPKGKAAAPSARASAGRAAAKGVAKGGAARRAARFAAAPPGARRSAAEPEVQPTLQDEGGPREVPGLNEEDQIRAAKYLPRELPKRVFEEERFLFPETYGVDRIRLLVRDPEWIFAYWDVSPEGMRALGRSLGERALALSRLTLRIIDPVGGGSIDILLPPGARWWYVRTDSARRTYRAELGVTLPSGEFRRIAESNTVVTPRVGPSAERARRKISYGEAREIPLSAIQAAAETEKRTGIAGEPWRTGALEGAPEPGETNGSGRAKGGASDTFHPGASDAFRR